MNDPHVVAPIYRIEHGDTIDYNQAQPLVREEAQFRLEVKENQARLEMKNHYATDADAQEAVEEYVRNWEFDACLEHGPDRFRLKFQRAQMVDRDPTPGQVRLSADSAIMVSGSLMKPTLIVSKYPSPPPNITLDPLDPNVQTMYQRYAGYRRGHEMLTSMANFCLTVLAHSKGNRREAAKGYQIGYEVLSKIGNLCNNKGGPSGARKAAGLAVDLTTSERRFLEQAIRKIIRRVAEKARDPNKDLPKISLSDLPRI